MTDRDHPASILALGFLLNQGMLKETDESRAIDFDEELGKLCWSHPGVTMSRKKLEKKKPALPAAP